MVSAAGTRHQSLDAVRGLAMALMAIDHVRVFAAVPAGGASADVFFTRWITHFCAPAFVFLAGSAVFLFGSKVRNPTTLARFLVTRGLVLIVLEFTLIRLAWTFNFDYAHYVLAGVIWVIGCCLVLLAGLVRLSLPVLTTLGAVLVGGHNLLDAWLPRIIPASRASATPWLWELLYLGPLGLGPEHGPFIVLYSLVPWIGVMLLGYAFGSVMTRNAGLRFRLCLGLGLGAVAVFCALRVSGLYGDPRPWDGVSALGFLNTTKYPASFQFLLMTLGPIVACIPLFERTHNALTRGLATLGSAPLFYYLLHIPVIHVVACVVSLARSGQVDGWLFENHPMLVPPAPPGYMWSLPLLYAVTIAVVVGLYFPCRWYASVKASRRQPWLRFL